MFSCEHSLRHKKDPCWPLICQGLCISTRTQQEKIRRSIPIFHPPAKQYFSKGLNIFKSRENPCRSEDNNDESSTELLPSVAMLADLPISNSSICSPNCTYHYHSWATWCWVLSLLVQLCTFLRLPGEDCFPWEASNRKLQNPDIFIFFSSVLPCWRPSRIYSSGAEFFSLK